MKEKLHVVSLSGGLGSFIELCLVKEKFGVENTFALFADVKMEDEDLYRFLKDSMRFVGCDFKKIAEGRNPWQVFQDVKFIGNSRIDPCSNLLKRKFIKKWLKANFDLSQIEVHVGIDYNEKHRLEGVQRNNPDILYRSLQIGNKMMLSTEEKIQFCLDRKIKPPRLYSLGFSHNNCGGFCVKAGLAQFKKLLETMPKRYQYHVERERETRAKNPKARPFLKKTISGKVHYLWLEDYRDMLQNNLQLDNEEKFDFGGCGCAL